MSAGAVLDQFSNLVKHMESLDPKLTSKIRPSKAQLEEFQTLTKKLKCATALIELHVAQLVEKANQRSAPTEHVLDLLERLQSSKLVDELDSSLRARLGKNLALIFRGPDVSAWDSDKVRSRRDKIRTRCEKLRAFDPHLILKWSITFQPSAWNQPTIMAENTFEFLIGKLETEEFGQITPQIMNILQSLQQEDPFKDCNPYHEFVQKATSTMTGHEVLDAEGQVMLTEHQQQDVIPHKRKHTEHQQQDAVSYKKPRTTESELFGGKSQYDDNHRQEQIMLIKRSKEINYKGSAMPADNIPHLIHRLPAAMTSSKQWNWERQFFKDNVTRLEGSIDRTDCLNVFVPKDPSQDISVTLIVGYYAGLELIDKAGVELIRA